MKPVSYPMSQFFVGKLNYPGKKSLVDKIKQRYLDQRTLKPDFWKEDVHTSIIYSDRAIPPSDYFHQAYIPSDLIPLLDDKVQSVVREQNLSSVGDFYISEIWYNAYTRGQYQFPHKHSDGQSTIFSGIYFIKFDENEHSAPRFYNPGVDISFDKVLDNKCLVIQPKIAEDDLILFLSDIGHDVPEQLSDKLRITISFNVRCNFHARMQYT